MKYPSNMSDAQWNLIKEFLPVNKGKKGFQLEHSNRDITGAIFYLNKRFGGGNPSGDGKTPSSRIDDLDVRKYKRKNN